MSGMDIFYFVLILLALGGILYLLHRSDMRTKNKYKLAAYKILEEKDPDPKKVQDTLRYLHLYGGRFRKDPEFGQLQYQLSNLLKDMEKFGKIVEKAKK